MKLFKAFMLFFLMLPTWANAEYLEVTEAWVREPPPMARVMVGYAKVKNIGSDPIWLTGIESSSFGAAEIHESYEENSIARMRRLPFVKIEAGKTAMFKPGGKHLMLFKPIKSLTSNDKVSFQFKLGNGQKEPFIAVVKKQ